MPSLRGQWGPVPPSLCSAHVPRVLVLPLPCSPGAFSSDRTSSRSLSPPALTFEPAQWMANDTESRGGGILSEQDWGCESMCQSPGMTMQRILTSGHCQWHRARKGRDGTMLGAFYPLLGLSLVSHVLSVLPNSSCDRGDLSSPRSAQLPSRHADRLAAPGRHIYQQLIIQ